MKQLMFQQNFVLILMLLCATSSSFAFQPLTTNYHTMNIHFSPFALKNQPIQRSQQLLLWDNNNNNNNNFSDLDKTKSNNDDIDNFDGKGFAGYLAPYALALVASLAITGAFVKFVLMDY